MDIHGIRRELAGKVKEIPPIGKILKFKLDEHFITIDGSGDTNELRDTDEEANCTITMSVDTYLKLQRKEIKPMIATLTGKLKVKGDIGLAQPAERGNA